MKAVAQEAAASRGQDVIAPGVPVLLRDLRHHVTVVFRERRGPGQAMVPA